MQTSSQFGNVSLGGAGSEGKPGIINSEIIPGLSLAEGLRAQGNHDRSAHPGKTKALCGSFQGLGMGTRWCLTLEAPSVLYPGVQEKNSSLSMANTLHIANT